MADPVAKTDTSDGDATMGVAAAPAATAAPTPAAAEAAPAAAAAGSAAPAMSDKELEARISAEIQLILKKSDIHKLTIKQVRQMLAEPLGKDVVSNNKKVQPTTQHSSQPRPI